MKNVTVEFDAGSIKYAFSDDGTLNDTEIVVMNRHENRWKEVGID